MKIPRSLNNKQSKLYAAAVIAERACAIASFDLMAARNRLVKENECGY